VWTVPAVAFLFLLAFVVSVPFVTAQDPASSPGETPATGELGTGPLVRWAIVPSIDDGCRLLADLLTVKLSSSSNIELVERERVDAALREMELAALWGEKSVGKRLQISRLLGADALLLLALGDAGEVPTVRAVIVDSRVGARLEDRLIGFSPDDAEETVTELSETIAWIRKRFPRGVRTLIGLAPFTSNTFVQDWDHLQTGFMDLIGEGLRQYPGVAALETEQVHDIVREHEVAGAPAVRRVLPVFVEGEYRVLNRRDLQPDSVVDRPGDSDPHGSTGSPNDRAAESSNPNNPKVRVVLRFHRGGRPPASFDLPEIPLDKLSRRMAERVPGVILQVASASKWEPLSAEKQYKLLWDKAERLVELGHADQAVNLLESVLLLRPNDLEARMAVIRCYGKKQDEEIHAVVPRYRHMHEFGEALQALESEIVTRLRDKLLTLMLAETRHGRYLIESRQLNPNEAISIFTSSYPHMDWQVDYCSLDAVEAFRIQREFFWTVAPIFKELDPKIRGGIQSAASAYLCSRGNLSRPSSHSRYSPPASAQIEWVGDLHLQLTRMHNLNVERIWVNGRKVEAPPKTYTREEAVDFYRTQFRFYSDVIPPGMTPLLYSDTWLAPKNQTLRFYEDGLVTRDEVEQHCRRLLDLNSRSARLLALEVRAEIEEKAPTLEVLEMKIKAAKAWLALPLGPAPKPRIADHLRDAIDAYDLARDPASPTAAERFSIDVARIPPGHPFRNYEERKREKDKAMRQRREEALARSEAERAAIAEETRRRNKSGSPIEIVIGTLTELVRGSTSTGFSKPKKRYTNLTYHPIQTVDWPEQPKYIGTLSPEMDFVLTESDHVYAMPEWGTFTTLVPKDRLDSDRVIDIQFDAPSRWYTVLTLTGHVYVLAGEGKPLAHFAPGDQLPPVQAYSPSPGLPWWYVKRMPVRLFQIQPGRYLLWGVDGSPRRSWLALLDYRGEEPALRVLLESKQVSRLSEHDHSVDIATRVTYLFWERVEGKPVLAVGREPLAFNSGWGKKFLTPLWIDFEADTMAPAPANKSEQYPMPYHFNAKILDPRLDRDPVRDVYVSRELDDPMAEDRRWRREIYPGGKIDRRFYAIEPKGRVVYRDNDTMALWIPSNAPEGQTRKKTLFRFPEKKPFTPRVGHVRDTHQQVWLQAGRGIYYYFHPAGTFEVDLNRETGRPISPFGDQNRVNNKYAWYFYTPRHGLFLVSGETVYRVAESRIPSVAQLSTLIDRETTYGLGLDSEGQTEFQQTVAALSGSAVHCSWKPAASDEPYVAISITEHSVLDEQTYAFLQRLPGIRRITVHEAPLDDAGLAELAKIGSLELLHLNGTIVTRDGLACLANLKNLRELHLGGDRLGDSALEVIPDIPRVTTLGVHGEGFTKEGVGKLLARSPRLEKIKWCLPSEK